MILSNKVVFLDVDQIFRISRHILLSFSTKVNNSRVSFIKGIRVCILHYSIRMLNVCNAFKTYFCPLILRNGKY